MIKHWKYKKRKILLFWVLIVFSSMLFFLFLHECGHGFGAFIDGKPVSTGFNRVGDYGKKPTDPDFRQLGIVEGKLDWSGLLGPLSNWIFTIVFTIILLQKKTIGKSTYFVGAAAIVNGYMRLVPMSMFLINASLGRFVHEDEAYWSLRSIKNLTFPMTSSEFSQIAKLNPEIILGVSQIYIWPLISFLLSSVCLIASYYYLIKTNTKIGLTRLQQVLFVITPVLVFPFVFIVANKLDNIVRINW